MPQPSKPRLLLEDQFFPVQAFFNAIPDAIFLRTIEKIAERVGQVYNETGILFPEEGDDTPDGMVEFFANKEEILVSINLAMSYASAALEAFCNQNMISCSDLLPLFESLKSIGEADVQN